VAAVAAPSPPALAAAPVGATLLVERPAAASALFWGGSVAAGLGLVGLAAGGYYGLDADSRRRAVTADMSQIEAAARADMANQSVTRANLLFAAGGVATATGLVLMLGDVFGLWGSVQEPSTVTVAPRPAGVDVVVRY
jgi:hypothetical protein